MTLRSDPTGPQRCGLCGGQTKHTVTLYLVEATFGPVIIEDVPVMRCIRCGRRTFSPEVIDQITAMLLDIEHGTLALARVPTGRVRYKHAQSKKPSG